MYSLLEVRVKNISNKGDGGFFPSIASRTISKKKLAHYLGYRGGYYNNIFREDVFTVLPEPTDGIWKRDKLPNLEEYRHFLEHVLSSDTIVYSERRYSFRASIMADCGNGL